MNIVGISVESVIAITGLSRRTWWRRISEGEVTKVANDARGRAMVLWAEIVPHISIPLQAEDLAFVLRADTGDAAAQNDIGQLFSIAGKHKAAFYWLQQAAQQNNADAMQWLGHCYISGAGVPQNDNLGLMWIAKAAAHGHAIAQAQISVLRPR